MWRASVIDCPPALNMLTVNALACSEGVIIPTECEFFSLRGLALLTDTVDKVRDRLNPRLKISGILVTRFDTRTVNAREVMARVVERFGSLKVILAVGPEDLEEVEGVGAGRARLLQEGLRRLADGARPDGDA
mgnify:CR=1 FL=1